jgi:hypothetical protein
MLSHERTQLPVTSSDAPYFKTENDIKWPEKARVPHVFTIYGFGGLGGISLIIGLIRVR